MGEERPQTVGRAGAGSHDHSTEGDGNPDINPKTIGQETPVEAVSADGLNSDRSARIGDLVYFDADSPGPYADGQDALSSVPAGSVLQLSAATYDVASQGRLVTDNGPWIRGLGGTRTGVGAGDWDGTRVRNLNGPVEPVIEYTGANIDSDVKVSDLYLFQSKAAPTMQITGVVRTTLDNLEIQCGGNPGVLVDGASSEFFRMVDTHIQRHSSYGVKIESAGWGYQLNNCLINTPNAAPAFWTTDGAFVLINGGQVEANGDGASVLVFDNNSGNPANQGGIISTTAETTATNVTFADIGSQPDGTASANQWENLVFSNCYAIPSKWSPVYRFNNAANCLVNGHTAPVSGFTGEIAEWTANSNNCGLILSPLTLSGQSITVDANANNPFIKVRGATDNNVISGFPTDSNISIHVDYSIDENSSVVWDGTDWYNVRTNSTFVP